MTREKEIKYASKDYVNYLLDKQEYHNETYTEYDIQQAFEKGAQWADDNHKSPWISVNDDLPCNHKELMENEYKTKKVLAVMRSDKSSSKNIEICYMTNQYSSIGIWYWINTLKTHVTHWMPLPELPKK